MELRKCLKCGAEVCVLKSCTCDDCGITCCHEKMKEIKANTSDGAREKHIPEYIIIGEKIKVVVPHVMEEEHYIEWLAYEDEMTLIKNKLKPGMAPEVEFSYHPNSKIYAYCNKHGLWEKEID